MLVSSDSLQNTYQCLHANFKDTMDYFGQLFKYICITSYVVLVRLMLDVERTRNGSNKEK